MPESPSPNTWGAEWQCGLDPHTPTHQPEINRGPVSLMYTAMWDPGGHVHEFVCVLTTWTISLGAAASPEAMNTPETQIHQWHIHLAVILLVSCLILCSIHTLWFLYLISPPEIGLSFLSHCAPSYLFPPLSLFHLYLTPTMHSYLTLSVIHRLVSQVVCQHTGVCRFSARVLSATEPGVYWDIGGFTPAFTNSHTFSGSLGKWQCNERSNYQFLVCLSLKSLPEGFSMGTMGSLRGRRERKTIFEHLQCAQITESVRNSTGIRMNNRQRGKEERLFIWGQEKFKSIYHKRRIGSRLFFAARYLRAY